MSGLISDPTKLSSFNWPRVPNAVINQDFLSNPLTVNNYAIDATLRVRIVANANFWWTWLKGNRGRWYGDTFRGIIDWYLLQDGNIRSFYRLSDIYSLDFNTKNQGVMFNPEGGIICDIPKSTQTRFQVLILSRTINTTDTRNFYYYYYLDIFKAEFVAFV